MMATALVLAASGLATRHYPGRDLGSAPFVRLTKTHSVVPCPTRLRATDHSIRASNLPQVHKRAASACPRRQVVPGVLAVLLAAGSAPAHAKYGEYANTAVPTQPESTLGSGAQDTGSRQVWNLEASGLSAEAIAGKKASVKADWTDMSTKVDKLIKQGKLLDVQSTLALRMAKMKSNMRDIARAENAGDLISYKEGSKDQPKFDYNTGMYGLTDVAQLTEDVFACVNRAYVAAGQRDAETVTTAWTAAKTTFDAWSAKLSL
mmetsp:Transcript_8611/g.29387  ORF Transcript_8611/g.29387 Transcript_8611/m.29387 type:complete len:262 (+) Transcript_8611:27-812(+)